MRVILNAEQLLYPSPGGIGRYVAGLLAGLRRVDPAGTVIPFVARHPASLIESTFAAVGVPPETLPVTLPLPRRLLYESWHNLDRPSLAWRRPALAGADLVHAPSVAVPPRGRLPLIVTIHDAAPVLYPDAFTWWGRRFHSQGIRAAVRRADLMVTVSQSAADEISGRLHVPAGRLRIVYGGIDPRPVDSGWASAYLHTLTLTERPYVFWVGTQEPRKNVRTLVAAMAELCRRNGGRAAADLVLAGYPGWGSRDIAAPDDRAILGGSLRELGRITDQQLWALYAGATVFAFPSRHEGFGLPVVEALSQGAAVVCSDIPVLHEVAGPAAVYVAPGDTTGWADAISTLLTDEAARRELELRGPPRSQKFTAIRQLEHTYAVYREAIGETDHRIPGS